MTDLLAQIKGNLSKEGDGSSKTSNIKGSGAPKKSHWDTLGADIAAQKDANPDQKALNFFLTPEEQQAVKAEESSTVEDILDVVDNVNRLFYAVAGGIRETIRGVKDEDSFGKDLQDVGSAMKKGFTREEKVTSRDIVRELSPEWLDKVEKETKFNLFGIDMLEMDALSVPTFVADVLLDPVTYIPFGAIVKGGKGLVGMVGKGIKGAAVKTLGEEVVGKIASHADDVLYKKIYPMVNIKAQFGKVPKAAGDGFAEASDLIETLGRSKEIADVKAAKMAVEVSKTGEKTGFLWKTQRLMDETDAKTMGRAFMKADDLGTEAFRNLRASKLGVAVEDVAQFEKIEKLVDGVRMAEDTAEEAAVLKELGDAMTTVKGRTAKSITNMLLEERGLKRFSNKIARSERDATIEFAKAKFDTARKLYSESTKKIGGEIDTIQKALRSDINLTGKMVAADVDDAVKSVTELGSNYQKLVVGEAPEAMDALKGNLSTIKRKIEGLTKYQADVTKGVQGFRKSDVPLKRINSLIRNLELDIGRQQVGVITDVGGKMRKQLTSTLSTLNKELRIFQKASVAEMSGIKGSVKAGAQLSDEIVKNYRTRLSDLLKQKGAIEKQFRAEAVMHQVAEKKAMKYASKAERKYYQTFSRLNSQKFNQQIMQEFWSERNQIFEGVMKAELPENLHGPARKLREVLDGYAKKMSEGPDPLLKGISPLYFPRAVQREYMDEVFNSIPKYRGTGKSMLRKRGFESSEEFTKYIEAQGGKVEDDAVIALMDYMKKADVAYARHSVEKELLARTGYASKRDLPREIKESLDYMYRDGTTSFNNPILEKIASGYAKVLNTTKATLTVINPAFHGRNILGFPFLAMTSAGMKSGLNPMNYADAFMIKAGKEGAIKAGGKEFTYKAIREAAEASGYFGAAFTRGDIKTSAKVLLDRYGKANPKRWMGEMFKATMHVEDYGRYGALVANLKAGMDLPQAMDAARKAMFDYNLINSPVDKAFQGLFGFYTFSRRNLPQQVITMLNDPKQYAITSRALDRISNRENLSDEELAALSSYEKETFKFFGEAIDGVREFKSLGFLPVEEAYMTLNSLRSGDLNKMLGSRISPVLGSFLDWYYGKNSFYGQDTGNFLPSKYERVIPDRLQKALGLTKRPRDKWRGGEKVGTEDVLFGDPDTIFMIRQFPLTSRFLGDLVNLADKVHEGQGGKGALKYTLGIKSGELDVDARNMTKSRKEQEALKKKAKTKGGKVFERLYVPKNYKDNSFEGMSFQPKGNR